MTPRTPQPGSPAQPALTTAALQQYAPALHRYLRSRLRHPEDVSDLAQEVFMRYWQIAQRESIRSPQAFLYRLAANFVYEFRLRARQGVVTADSEQMAAAEDHSGTAWDNPLENQLIRAEQVTHTLRSMPALWQTILLMSKREGLRAKEIAQRLRLSEKTVYMYLGYAVAHFKKELRRP